MEELKRENAVLRSQNDKYILEIQDLNAKVKMHAVNQPGGLATEEERKALAVREAELTRKEKRLIRVEEGLRLDQTRLDDQKRDFYKTQGTTAEDIGKAKAILEEREGMKKRLALAEERANNWLKAIYAISILFFVGVIALVAFLMHMAAKNRRVDMAMRTVESVSLSAHEGEICSSPR